ncbi:hypothetical protein A2304_04490 [Candidatus Uhrbacteria bacterium RIFOXYB2_FULL_57_15]|uniref:Uncharacterized protein n=1 Tax=Candidatus Uhrbacteria bacterium RIFOXYB2_FULL_57_15 TaxID=1802422 RepID=A0A1F7WA07_9BACT|nr:MAG: hypothetical protein A2304_04490 [Candidatus Uhrbacteria bacterium RIFOXYB2_FULL_57_15]OGM00455.1 MAG: hypothetical protein A2501_00630 [Candidatus Uhrbacteria bacterium RIFOXYC12_FULL_57_11]
MSFWWVFCFGFFGTIGMLLATHHFAHVIGHALHSPVAQMIVWVIGLWACYGLMVPVLEQRTALSGVEIWCYLLFGSAGILFLLYEAGHWLHHHPRIAWAVSIAGLAMLLALWYFRPPGSTLSPVPPISPRAMPAGSTGHPGFGGPSGGGSATASTGAGGGGTLDCARLSPRAFEAARTKGLCP